MNARWRYTVALTVGLSALLIALPSVQPTEAYLSGTATGEMELAVGTVPEPPDEEVDPDIPAECGRVANYDQVIKVANPETALLLYDLSGNDIIILTRALPGGWLDGKGGDDCIAGNDGTDRLFGGPGNDILIGRGGNDILEDHEGENVMYGGAGIDSCLGVAEKYECENAPSLPPGIRGDGTGGVSTTGDDPTPGGCLPSRGRPSNC